MRASNSVPVVGSLPPGMNKPCSLTIKHVGLFRINLATALARLGISPDELRRWHDRGWISFNEQLGEELDEFDDPRLHELNLIRDIARSGLSDAQIEALLSRLPKPLAYNPDRIAFSFRHGWIEVEPPVEIPEPSEVIEAHLDEWVENADDEVLERLHDQIIRLIESRAEL